MPHSPCSCRHARLATRCTPIVLQPSHALAPHSPVLITRPHRAPIADDPVTMSNKRGYISFATSGTDSRTTQMFINVRRLQPAPPSLPAPTLQFAPHAALHAAAPRVQLPHALYTTPSFRSSERMPTWTAWASRRLARCSATAWMSSIRSSAATASRPIRLADLPPYAPLAARSAPGPGPD